MAVALLAVIGGIRAATAAQPATCPSPEEDASTVVIASPEADADVAGRVEVTGRVESPTPLFQVELFVGDSRKDFVIVNPPVTTTDFTLVWDASAVAAGPATLLVVACGGTADLGRLVRGTATVDVQVGGSEPAPSRTLVEVRPDDDQVDPSVLAGAVIAVPAALCLLFALGRRRSS
ncbi:MAG TPA: Ig-like domain-containing protein [Acidimicrobiales bacterium]